MKGRLLLALVALTVVCSATVLSGASAADAPGAKLWLARFNNAISMRDSARDFVLSSDGTRAFVTGTRTTIAYDTSSGARLWTAVFNGYSEELGVSNDGTRVFVTGTAGSISNTSRDYMTVAYDAATGRNLWSARYDGPEHGWDTASALAVSADGTKVFVTGEKGGNGPNAADGIGYGTVAYDAATGAQLWVAHYYDDVYGGDDAYEVAASSDGTKVIVTGVSYGGTSGFDYATVAYDASTGKQLWAARYDDASHGADHGRALAITPDGTKVVVTGQSYGGSTHGDDYATVAYDASTGARLWLARYNGGASGEDQARALALSGDGTKAFVAGYSNGSGTGSDYATIAYGVATGAKVWAARYDGPANGSGLDAASSLAAGDGKVFVTGQSDGGLATGADAATVAYDAATGAPAWTARYDGPAHALDYGASVASTGDGTKVFVTGQSDGGPTTLSDYVTIRYDGATGAGVWTARYDGPAASHDVANSVALNPAGDKVFVAGTSNHGYATLAYAAATGQRLWTHLTPSLCPSSEATAARASPDGTKVFVTGRICGHSTTFAYDASTGAQLWSGAYGFGTSNTTALATSHDGTTVFVTGTTHGAPPNYYLTIAYDAATGIRLWYALYNGPAGDEDKATSVGVSADDSRVFVTGQSVGANGTDYATLAFDASTGKTLWSTRYDGPGHGNDGATGLAVSGDGRVVVTGSSYGGSAVGSDYTTIAYSAATGAKLWAARYNGPGSRRDAATAIALSGDGTKAFVTGVSSFDSVRDDYATLGYDTASGAQLWATRYHGGANGSDSAGSIAAGGGKVFVTGRSYGGAALGYDYLTVAFDQTTGAALWPSRYDGPAHADDSANGIAATSDGSRVLVTGDSNGGPATGADFATVAYQG